MFNGITKIRLIPGFQPLESRFQGFQPLESRFQGCNCLESRSQGFDYLESRFQGFNCMGSRFQGSIFLGSGCREFRFHILWHMFVFLQWGNPNWYQQYGFLHPRNPYMHAYMHIFGLSNAYMYGIAYMDFSDR